MYKLGQRSPHRQKLYAALILLLAGLVVTGAWAVSKYLQPETSLTNSDGIVRHVDIAKAPTKQVTTSLFSMEVPRDWRSVTSNLIPAAQYSWRGTGQQESARSLDVYVDAIPTNMAVNKLLPVRGSNDRVVVGDTVSDNCVNFTDSTKADKRTGTMLAKWSGVNFYCDTGNYARNVVGTGSPEAINSVTLTGSVAGTHRFFFVYTDHSAEADYTILTDLLNSFHAR